MTGSANHNELTDNWLVAYLDGALAEGDRAMVSLRLANDPELAQRLALLERGGRDFKRSYAPLLDVAPDHKMQGMFADLMVEPEAAKAERRTAENIAPYPPRNRNSWSSLTGMAIAASLTLVVFSGGIYTGWQTGDTPLVQPTKIGWRQAAAQYLSLFNKQTLEGLPADEMAQREGLVRVSQALGLSLTREKISIDRLAFMGTQILHLKGKPLVQIAYLHNGETPVALCIIKSKKTSVAQKVEKRLGLNIVHWISDGHGYMLIGKIPQEELRKIAAPLLARFS